MSLCGCLYGWGYCSLSVGHWCPGHHCPRKFFLRNLKGGNWGEIHPCGWLQLRAANGLPIPYVGYVEFDIQVLGKHIPKRGVLVVKDPPGGSPNPDIPGVLGMNVIQECYEVLSSQYGSGLFDLPAVKQDGPWQHALLHCHHAQLKPEPETLGQVRVRGKTAIRIPGGTTKLVAATCPSRRPSSHGSSLFEPSTDRLPAGLLVSPAVVKVVEGTTYIPVVNVGNQDAILPPRLSLGSLCPSNIVSLPAGISELPGEAPSGETVATVSAHIVERSTLATIEAIDLSPLTQQEQGDVRSLLRKYQSVFSTHDGDLGCTNLISHEIPLLDDAPVRQRF